MSLRVEVYLSRKKEQRKTLKGSANCHSRIQFQLASRADSLRLMFDIQWGVFLIRDVSESITKKELFLSLILMYFLCAFIWVLYGTYNVKSRFQEDGGISIRKLDTDKIDPVVTRSWCCLGTRVRVFNTTVIQRPFHAFNIMGH